MRKLLVVTGGTRGIGKAIAWKFASAGNFDVITCSRNPKHLEEFKTSFAKEFPDAGCYTFQADFEDKSAVVKFAAKVKGLGRKINVLVNNAGIFLPGGILEEEEGVFEKLMAVNLSSAYHFTRSVSEQIKKDQTHIFNICSTASITAYTNGGTYCISKFALLGFSKVLREELKAFGAKVTAILPGATFTDSWAAAGLPETRFMKAEDVAEVIFSAYSLSPSACPEEILLRPLEGDI
jgi:short-subunit dehydrogenase